MKAQKQPPEVFCKKSVFKILEKFTGKHLCLDLFFKQISSLRPFKNIFFTEHILVTASESYFLEHVWTATRTASESTNRSNHRRCS